MNGAMAEALALAEGEQDMEKKIEHALACPCLGECPACCYSGREGDRVHSAAPQLLCPHPCVPAVTSCCVLVPPPRSSGPQGT